MSRRLFLAAARPRGLARALVLVLVLAGAAIACRPAAAPEADVRAAADDAIVATGGMVSSAHPLATRAGVAVLADGGNAFDAALAVAATLTVVEPMNSNLMGGYGTLLVYDAGTGTTRYLDNNGRFPAAVDSAVFRPPADLEQMMRTAKAVSTPGNLYGFELLAEQYGSRPWGELLGEAIRLADQGFEVTPRLAEAIAGAWQHFSDYSRAIYGRDGEPLAAGETLIQSDLAAALRVVAKEGAAAVYGGGLGIAIDAEMRRQGGFLALADLEAHRSEWLEPIGIEYRGHRVVTAAPPSNSFASLVCLGIMSRYDVAALGHNTTAYLHRFAEATKHAFWARLRYAGGPEEPAPPLDMLLDEGYWQEQADRLDPQHASTFTPPGPSPASSPSTTHYVVADRDGNVVSATLTLGHGFGSAVMVGGTGIWLNNSLAYSTFEPKGNPMDALPGRRKHSSKTPTLIFEGDRPVVALGTPGGHTIPQSVPQMVLNLIGFGMPLQAAIDAPRVAFAEPNRLLVGEGLPEAVRTGLAELGHEIVVRPGIGVAHALTLEYGDDGSVVRFTGAADRRGEGLALGVP